MISNPNPSLRVLSVLLSLSVLLAVNGSAVGIRVVSEPTQATVFLDGRFVGGTPAAVSKVQSGDHLLELRRHGYKPWKRAVSVSRDGQEFSVVLDPLATGSLRVLSKPVGATVFLDGIVKGRTPTEIGDLVAGIYSIRLELEEWLPWQSEAEVREGQESVSETVLGFRGEAMLLEEIGLQPHKIVNYYELAHHYALQQNFERVKWAFAKGFDASVHPDAQTDESRRLCQELDRVCTGQYEFAGEEAISALKPELMALCRASIERVPRNVQNYWVLGQMLGREKRWEEARAVYENALSVVLTARGKMYYECAAAGAIYQEGWALERKKEYAEAMATYEELVNAFPKPWHTRTALGRMAVLAKGVLKDPKRAVACQRRLIALHPGNDNCPRIQLDIVDVLRRDLKDYAGAVEACRTFLRSYPKDDRCPEAQLRIGEISRQDLKETEAAVREYRALLSTYPDSDLCADALAGLALADPGLAMQMHQRILKTFPHSVAADAVDTSRAGKAARDKAAKLLRTTTALTSKAVISGQRAVRYEKLAERSRARGDVEKARKYADYVEKFSVAARKHSDRILTDCATILKGYPAFHHAREAQRQIISVYADVFRDAEAANHQRREFLRMFPDDDSCPSIRYDIGNALFGELRKHEEAVDELKALIQDYPESDQCVRAQALIASIYSHDNGHFDRERSIEENRRLIEMFPDHDGNASARGAIGRIFHYRVEPGDDEQAAAEYLSVIREYPYTSVAFSAEYRMDQHKGGLQLAELQAEGKVTLDPETGWRKTDP